MALNNVEFPYAYAPNFDSGRPVYNGYLYFGEPDLDPEIIANQKTIYFLQEDGNQVVGIQPVRTGAGGVPTYNGSPVAIKIDGDYSIKVLNSSMSQVYYSPNGNVSEAIQNALQTVATLAELQGLGSGLPANTSRTLMGRVTDSDGGEGLFKWRVGDYSAQVTADEVNVGAGDGGRWVKGNVATTAGAWERITLLFGAFPEMYGAFGGATDTTVRMNKMLANNITVRLTEGKSYSVGALLIGICKHLYGKGTLQAKGGTDAITLYIDQDDVEIEGITLRKATDGTGLTKNLNNDTIRISNSDRVSIHHVTIAGSWGTGIAGYNSGSCEIHFNNITDCYDNGIIFGNIGADNNRITWNTIDGTTSQNGIFVTASSGSTPTANFIYDNVIAFNTVLNAGDTNIETGIHTVGTRIHDNFCLQKNLPAILFRDALSCHAYNNVIHKAATATAAGIAVVRQTEPEAYKTKIKIHDNVIKGILGGATMIQVQQSEVSLEGNEMYRGTFAGDVFTADATLVGSPIGLYGEVSDIVIKEQTVSGMNPDVGLFAFSGGRITITPPSTVVPLVISPSNNKEITMIGQASDFFTAPLVQYSGVVPLKWTVPTPSVNAYKVARVTIQANFDRGIKGVFDFYSDGSLTTVQTAAELVNGIAGFAHWGVGYDAPNLLIQRRGAAIYPDWVTATGYTAGDKVVSNGRLYNADTTGTSGGTAPVHKSGAVSDGGVTWSVVSLLPAFKTTISFE